VLNCLVENAVIFPHNIPTLFIDSSIFWLEKSESVLAPVELLDELSYRFYDLSGKPFQDINRFTSNIPVGHIVNVIDLPEGKSP